MRGRRVRGSWCGFGTELPEARAAIADVRCCSGDFPGGTDQDQHDEGSRPGEDEAFGVLGIRYCCGLDGGDRVAVLAGVEDLGNGLGLDFCHLEVQLWPS